MLFPLFFRNSGFRVPVMSCFPHFSVVGFINRGTVEELRIVQLDPLLDARTLGLQTSLFKLTMRSNAKSAMEEPQDKNPVSKL
jgi:hypothetical protein